MSEFRPPAVVRADAELTVAFRTGDERAVRELFERCGALVFTIAERLTDAADAADEVTTHTFLQAWRNSEAFEPGRAFAPWLASLAARVATARSGHSLDVAGADPAVVDELLADPSGLDSPPVGLDDRIVAAVLSEATIAPSDLYTADDLRAAQAAARSSRSLRTVAFGAAGAGLVLVAGILLLSAIGGTSEGGSTTIELRPTGRVLDVSGSIDVVSVAAGLQVVVDAPSLPDPGTGQWYEGLVLLDDGSTVGAGTFTGGSDVTLTAAVSLDDTDQFVIVLAGVDVDGAFTDRDVVLRAPLP